VTPMSPTTPPCCPQHVAQQMNAANVIWMSSRSEAVQRVLAKFQEKCPDLPVVKTVWRRWALNVRRSWPPNALRPGTKLRHKHSLRELMAKG
jgi:hypothetical protein